MPKSQVTSHKSQRCCHVGYWALCLVLWALCLGEAQAQPGFPGGGYSEPQKPGAVSTDVPPQLRDVTFKQRLGDKLPLDATFRDETGRVVTLEQFFGRRPAVLAFVLQLSDACTQVMNGLSSALKVMPFTAGQDFEVVLVSFDPRDTPAIAAEKKRAHLEYWSAEKDAAAWHLLTGDEETISRVTSAAGFTYRWDEPSGQFAHISGILVVNPDGRLSRHFYGVEYSPKELRMALVESGQGRIGTVIDELLYCFHYDPESGWYGVVVMNPRAAGRGADRPLHRRLHVVMRSRESHQPVQGVRP